MGVPAGIYGYGSSEEQNVKKNILQSNKFNNSRPWERCQADIKSGEPTIQDVYRLGTVVRIRPDK